MAELRWNPILGQWVIVAAHRRNRPQRLEGQCPFCTGSGKVPDQYVVYAYPNDFPSLLENPPESDVHGTSLYPVETLKGVCEVVLYSSEHNLTLTDLHLEHIMKLIYLWRERYEVLGAKEFVKYVLVFENKGEVMGVTISHPHGQIYAYSFIPPKPQRELENEKQYWVDKGFCLGCEIIKAELEDSRRVIVEQDHSIAFVPFFAAYPYEVHIYPKRHIQSLSDLKHEEIESLAVVLKTVLQKYDNLFGFSFPYMMIMNQKPTDGFDYVYHHFRVELYPPLIDRQTIRYIAGSETGSGVQINPTNIENRARELKLTEPRSDIQIC